MPASTVPATPAQVGAAGGAPSASAAGNVAGPDHSLLSFMQFQFVRHARINDLHQALNNNYGDAVADTADIDQLFTNNRADIKSDADLLRTVRRLLIEKVDTRRAILNLSCTYTHELTYFYVNDDY